jgi:hypothetical protein
LHAEDFAHRGRFQMGNLRVYAAIEDEKRQDPTEGDGHFQRFGIVTTVEFMRDSDETFVSKKPGYVHTHVELLHPKFVFCCAAPGVDLDHLRKQFGPWLVRIDQPRQFAQEVSAYLETLPYKFAGGVEGCFVQYNKGDRTRRPLNPTAQTHLSYMQKPSSFSEDNEFRFVVIVIGNPRDQFDGDHLPIDLGRALDYVTII